MHWLGKLLIFLLILLVLSIIGQWLWNNYLVNAVTFAKPLRNWWQFLMLLLLAGLLFGPKFFPQMSYNPSLSGSKLGF